MSPILIGGIVVAGIAATFVGLVLLTLFLFLVTNTVTTIAEKFNIKV